MPDQRERRRIRRILRHQRASTERARCFCDARKPFFAIAAEAVRGLENGQSRLAPHRYPLLLDERPGVPIRSVQQHTLAGAQSHLPPVAGVAMPPGMSDTDELVALRPAAPVPELPPAAADHGSRPGLRAVGQVGQALPRPVRRHRRQHARPRPPQAGPGHRRAGGKAPAHLELLLQRTERAPGGEAVRPVGNGPRLFLQLGRGSQRGDAQAGAAPFPRARRDRPLPRDRVQELLPRPHHGRARRYRTGQVPRRLRSTARRHARRVRRRGRRTRGDGAGRRGHPRGAGAGRGRRGAGPRRLSSGAPRHRRRARCAAARSTRCRRASAAPDASSPASTPA